MCGALSSRYSKEGQAEEEQARQQGQSKLDDALAAVAGLVQQQLG